MNDDQRNSIRDMAARAIEILIVILIICVINFILC